MSSASPQPVEVVGIDAGFCTDTGQFVFEYQCDRCKLVFRDSATEILPPVLCHQCFVGDRRDLPPKVVLGNEHRRKGKRGGREDHE